MRMGITLILLVLTIFTLNGCVEAGLVGTGVTTNVVNQGSGSPETTAKTIWRDAEPFGIVDYAYRDGILTIVMKNNVSEMLILESVAINGASVNSGKSIAPASSEILKFAGEDSPVCQTGEKFTIEKSKIQITYNSQNIGERVQMGLSDLVGTCN